LTRFLKREPVSTSLENAFEIRAGRKMNWVYWNTFWSLAVSLVWFMTIVSHPDAVVVDRHYPKPKQPR
jgi:hypothetical protein